MKKETFYITTPLYYVNSELHIGGAYTTIAADILARYHRAHGKDVFFLTGSDEHGLKILREAEKVMLKPKDFADKIVMKFQELWRDLEITHDHFIRTTDAHHEESAKKLFKRMLDNGDIYLGHYEGLYCTPCETYYSVGSELCENCQRPLERISEDNYFFRLSRFRDVLLKHIDENPNFILPAYRRNEIRNRIEAGLEDISISRSSLKWGVEVPNNPDHVIYVWFEALMNYITALGAPDDAERMERYWPANVHLMAKDIIWFHSVIWPAMLLSLGYKPPKTVFAHGWWTINGDKISKSKGNVIYPRDITSKYGRDALRFFLIREVPFGRDGDFTLDSLDSRYNSELANGLGNLLMRTVSMIDKYFDGMIPEPTAPYLTSESLKESATQLSKIVAADLEEFALSNALEHIWQVVRDANKFVEVAAPWTLAKQNKKDELATVLYTLAETSRLLLVNLYPFIPETAPKGIAQLGISWNANDLGAQEQWGWLKPSTIISKPFALYPRLDVSPK